MADNSLKTTEPGLTPLGRAFVFLFVAGCLYAAYMLFIQKKSLTLPTSTEESSGGNAREVGIAYGTEKQRWMEWAVGEFAKTKEGRRIKIRLMPMGSLEGAQALLAQNKAIDVWSPASAVYKDVFLQEWEAKYGGNPIVKEENLALSPMVFVMWKERHDAWLKDGAPSFRRIASALQEKGGWGTLARHPEWGFFKFGHTHPNQSNSGLLTLVLAAYEYDGKTRGLGLPDVVNPQFQGWLQTMERGVTGLSNSTGNMMREMVLKGPSSYDIVLVYENVAIDYLKNAEGRWGELQVDYPKFNVWNENPYYIMNTPWSTKERREAAETFLAFLMTEPIQKEALAHGFRPGNPNVAIRFPGSPFEALSKYGIRVDVGTICEPPKAEVINNLLAGWQRSQAGR